jgi:hypothetical protein
MNKNHTVNSRDVDLLQFYSYIYGMTTRKRPGRPRKSSSELKTDSLLVRLEAGEKQAFRDAAKLAGIDLSTWARERMRRSAVKELESAGLEISFLKPSSKQ